MDTAACDHAERTIRRQSRQPKPTFQAAMWILRDLAHNWVLWVNRYEELGHLRELAERSRKPHHRPNKTPDDIERKFLELRASVGWGARRLVALLRQQNVKLAASTVHRILQRHERVGMDNSHWAAWIMEVLLADDPLPQLQRELPSAAELPRLAHFIIEYYII